MNAIYVGGFDSESDVFSNFYVSEEESKGVEILYAQYNVYGYEGDAHVIFRKDGKLYEVSGSHCSCYGFETQWQPEETTVAALLFRPNVAEEAKEILRSL